MGWWERLGEQIGSDPWMTVAFLASAFAYATTPLAFLVLGRLNYLRTRRGRSFQPPSLASVVVGMMLVMGIPAIFCALTLKSRTFDANRYEFDPNRAWSVMEQGRGYNDLREVDQALKKEQVRLDEERRALANGLKDLDKAIVSAINEIGGASPNLVASIKKLEAQLGPAHQWAKIDAPQQLLDLTATPVELLVAKNAPSVMIAGGAPAAGAAPKNGLPTSVLDSEMATVPAPQKPLAKLLPLADIPAGWSIGVMEGKHLETFNADNLYEKIDGRAESFLLYDVKGMAYTFYHPTGDESQEVQLYIFELGNALKALGKYGSEKPDDNFTPVAVGKDGYAASGSTLFYLDKYYIQLVSTRDDPKFTEFVTAIARKIEASIDPALAATRSSEAPAAAPPKPKAGPEEIFALLPKQPKHGEPKYAAADVFGYSFLSDVFLTDYTDGNASWQGFLHSCATADEAKALFEKYAASAKDNGAEIKKIEAEGADQMMVVSNFGLIDVVFAKGNAFAGANGAPGVDKAEAFARAFAKALPAQSPYIPPDNAPAPSGENPEG
ncbi:MAG: DUF6599 family protein [Isosphaeraceae bacterium]